MNKKELNYQQARTVRGQSLKDVISDELIRGKGVGSAITGAIGLKTQARIKGIKEKFDPLNIAKFLTFGSRLGPALYGRMFGRSQKDIEYFAGRAKPIGRGKQKLVKDGTDEGDEDNGGMKTVLKQILTFLKKSHERDMTLREEENNLRESNKLDDDTRHRELLKALGVKTAGEEPTATIIEKEKEDKGFLQKITDSIQNMIEGIKKKISEIVKSIEQRIEKMLEKGLLGLASKLKKLLPLSALSWMVGIAAFAGWVAFNAWLTKKFVDYITAQTDKEIEVAAAKGDVPKTEALFKKKAQLSDFSPLAIYGASQPDYDEAGTYDKTRGAIKKEAEKGNEVAKAALAKMDADYKNKKEQYIKNLNLPQGTAPNPAQMRDADMYALDMIDINGGYAFTPENQKLWDQYKENFKKWGKPTPGEIERDEFMKNAIKEKFSQTWKMLTAPDPITEDSVMHDKMWEVVKKNPLGPWHFDKTVPGYNEWQQRRVDRLNKSKNPEVVDKEKTGQLNTYQDEYAELLNKLANSRLERNAATQTAIASIATPRKSPSPSSIPMPLGRNLQESFREATYTSFVG